MIKNIGLTKEHPDIPESYGIKFYLVTGKEIEFKCASHIYIDKVWDFERDEFGEPIINKKTGKRIPKIIGVHPNPFYEIWTKDNEMMVVETSAISNIEFDDNWSEIVSIKKKLDEKGR